MIKQQALLNSVQKLGSYSTYGRLTCGNHQIPVVMFADADKPSTNAQLGFVDRVFIRSHHHGSTFHTIQCNSHLCSRPFKSIASSEVLAVGSAVDKGKVISHTLPKLLQINVSLSILVD